MFYFLKWPEEYSQFSYATFAFIASHFVFNERNKNTIFCFQDALFFQYLADLKTTKSKFVIIFVNDSCLKIIYIFVLKFVAVDLWFLSGFEVNGRQSYFETINFVLTTMALNVVLHLTLDFSRIDNFHPFLFPVFIKTTVCSCV